MPIFTLPAAWKAAIPAMALTVAFALLGALTFSIPSRRSYRACFSVMAFESGAKPVMTFLTRL